MCEWGMGNLILEKIHGNAWELVYDTAILFYIHGLYDSLTRADLGEWRGAQPWSST